MEVQITHISPNLLKNWAFEIYKTPTDYWTFRKMVRIASQSKEKELPRRFPFATEGKCILMAVVLQITLQLSLSCFAEYVFHLTRLNPDMMFIHQDSGLINVSYFKFDVDDSKSKSRKR